LKASRNWILATLPVALIAAFAELGYAVINNSAFQVYCKNGLGISAFTIVKIMAPFYVSEVLFKGPFGVLADRVGRKALMVAGPAITIFTPIITILIPYHPHTLNLFYLSLFGFMRLLDGAGAALLWPAMFAYIGDVVEREKRASAMSLLNVTYIIGLALGFLAGGWVNDTFGPLLSGEAGLKHQIFAIGREMRHAIRDGMLHHHGAHSLFHRVATGGPDISIFLRSHYYPSFYLAAFLFGAATIIALVAIRPRTHKLDVDAGPDQEAAVEAPMTFRGFVEAIKSVPNMIILTLVAFLGIGCIALLVKIFALDELNITETEFGQLILLPAAVVALLAVPLGYMSDAWGKVRSVRLGFILCTIGMWSLIVMYWQPQMKETSMAVAGAMLGLGFVIAFPAWMALLTTVSKTSQRGTIIGAVSTAQGVGVLCGALIGGRLYDGFSPIHHVSHISPFYASAILLTISSVLSFILLRSDAGSEPGSVEQNVASAV
jgi:MFS family permease